MLLPVCLWLKNLSPKKSPPNLEAKVRSIKLYPKQYQIQQVLNLNAILLSEKKNCSLALLLIFNKNWHPLLPLLQKLIFSLTVITLRAQKKYSSHEKKCDKV